MKIFKVGLAALAILFCASAGAAAEKVCDPHKDNTLYTIGYSHLDTQWRWTFQDSIYMFIANTMRDNFKLFEKYPGYRFNFTGSNRYLMMEEYYPEDFQIMKDYIAQGKWYVSGSSVDENDANVPSTESLVRNVMYGNLYFKKEFGKISEDYMLPDCFGFPAFMPSVLAHAGVKGFSTQKLTWRSAVGIPFNVGIWEGPDGRSVMAALNPGAYVSRLSNNLATDEYWLQRTKDMGALSGFSADFKYFGTGDQGGAPDDTSAQWLQTSLDTDGPLCVDAAQSDDIFQDATQQEKDKMKKFKGDMLLIEHSAGSLTSQSYIKRWNRKNELLADNAERASVIADWIGALPYPTERIKHIWYLILGGQMHDILPGTSVPKAYEFSWNDAVMALNGSAGTLESAAGAAVKQLDTNATGAALVVYNPLSRDREDLVQVSVDFGGAAKSARVFDPAGAEVPSQVVGKKGNALEIVFLAKVPAVGYAVYDARKSDAPSQLKTGLSAKGNVIENNRFKVTIDKNGDVSSVYDKVAKKEALSKPAGLEMMEDSPRDWPAWNIDWEDWSQPARARVAGPAKLRVVENGPARAAIEIVRELDGSTFSQVISLAAGDAGNRVEFDTSLDWRTQSTALKATFPLNVKNKDAAYNLELGVIDRETNNDRKFEVPSHQWFDLTDADGSYGVSILEDSKFASDKPDESTVRLTLVRTPGCNSYCDQATQDMGKHEILYAMAPHQGDWRKGDSHWQAMRLNQPLQAFTAPKHPGKLGKSFSFMKINTPQVAARALKKAEESDEIIVRLQELSGKAANGVKVSFAAPVISAREVDGQEREMGPATIKDGALAVDLEPFILRAYAVKIGKAAATSPRPASMPLELQYNLAAMTHHKEKAEKGFDGKGNVYSADMIPEKIESDGVEFKLGPGGAGKLNAVEAKGQKIKLPKGEYDRLYVLAAASGGDVKGEFKIGDKKTALNIQEWTGYVGQWDNRIWKDDRNIYGLRPAFTKRAEIAWYASHYHNEYGRKMAYNYSYMFKYGINVPKGATELTLPNDGRIKIFAITAVKGDIEGAAPAQLLYDDFDREEDAPSFSPAEGSYKDAISVKLQYPWYSRYDELRYTTDGSDVTPTSPLYRSPISVSKKMTIKARAYGAGGRAGLLSTASYDVNDVTPPSVKEVTALELAPFIRAYFSEPVDEATAENAANYSVSNGVTVKSAILDMDQTSVVLELSSVPLSSDQYTLTISNIRDLAKTPNAVKTPADVKYNAGRAALDLKIRTKDIGYSLGTPGISRDFAIKGDPKSVKGPFGLAVRFGGEPDAIVLNNRADLNPRDKISITAWVRAKDWEGNRRIVQKGDEDNQYRLLSENGQLLFDLAGIGILTCKLPTPGEWTHVAATYDGRRMRLYTDGKLLAEKNISGDISVTENPLYIGTKNANSTPVDYFIGDMDKITIWGYALSEEEIAVLAKKN